MSEALLKCYYSMNTWIPSYQTNQSSDPNYDFSLQLQLAQKNSQKLFNLKFNFPIKEFPYFLFQSPISIINYL